MAPYNVDIKEMVINILTPTQQGTIRHKLWLVQTVTDYQDNWRLSRQSVFIINSKILKENLCQEVQLFTRDHLSFKSLLYINAWLYWGNVRYLTCSWVVNGLAVTGLAVTSWEVTSWSVTGWTVTILRVTGLAVTGWAVTSWEVTGWEVIGWAVPSWAVTGFAVTCLGSYCLESYWFGSYWLGTGVAVLR